MDFLSKPVDPSELALRIRNTLAATAYRDFLAKHDALTGLPNKLRYREVVSAGLAAAQESGSTGALVHVGVDHLSRINDALGHATGDQVLQRIGKRLASCVATEGGGFGDLDSPSLYRFDGDEFAVFIPSMEDVETAAGFINKLLEAATTAISRAGAEMFVTCSIGVSVFPQDGREGDLLMSNATLAMHHAKESGRHTYEFFSRELNAKALEKLNLGADLQRALARGELEVLFQPRIDVLKGTLMGAEVVVRWARPKLPGLEGEALLQLAATSEMSMALTEWTLDQLLHHTQAWRAQGLEIVPLGVNISLKQLPVVQLMDSVRNAIRSGLKPQYLCLELHEASTLDSRQEEVDSFVSLKKMGVRMALDHFGAGHSSLIQLRRFPVDEVKVDPLFFHLIEENQDNAAIVIAMMAMARSLGLTFVATGIHTLHQLAFLKARQCDQCQGRLFGGSMTAPDFAAKWLAHEKKAN
jgi:diguanylate cyclase (GGDEF)-like protein